MRKFRLESCPYHVTDIRVVGGSVITRYEIVMPDGRKQVRREITYPFCKGGMRRLMRPMTRKD